MSATAFLQCASLLRFASMPQTIVALVMMNAVSLAVGLVVGLAVSLAVGLTVGLAVS